MKYYGKKIIIIVNTLRGEVGNIKLTWGAATDVPICSGIESYTIKRINPDNSLHDLGVVNNNTFTFVDTSNLEVGSYSYIIYATDRVGHLTSNSIKNDVVLSAPANNGGKGRRENTVVVGGEGTNSYICYENWKCNDWSDCVDGEQTRTCTDLNSCGTNLNKPPIFQECALTPQTTSRNFLTGAVTGITNFATSPGGIATSSGLIIILIGSIILVNFRKNRLSKEK